ECHCPLCERHGPDDDRLDDPRLRRTADLIGDFGWRVQAISDGDGLPGWAYSIGLWHGAMVPEVSMFGLGIQDMGHWINDLGRALRGGPGQVDEPRAGILPGDYPIIVKPVHDSWYHDFFGTAIDFYGLPPLPITQAVWPDREGRFPWEEGCAESCRTNQ